MRSWKVYTYGIDPAQEDEYDTGMLCMVEVYEDYTRRVSVVDKIDSRSSPAKIREFFKNRSKLGSLYRDVIYRGVEDGAWIQYALYDRKHNVYTPVVYFTIEFEDGETLTVDKAFETSMVKKNGVRIPFGKFPFDSKRKYPVRRESKLEKLVCKYLANRYNQ